MDKYTDYLGIDVSKKTLDVMTSQQKHFQFSNDLKGFREFAKIIPRDGLCITEVTGIYHLQLATFLHSKSIAGIGERTAVLLIISTDGFKNFYCSKQLASYFGLAPTERFSGTSVNGTRKATNHSLKNKILNIIF